ncbi:Uncharacterised protein [Providencia heimbachae]|nr:Uncharacterised protein [Providencia heimbachae]
MLKRAVSLTVSTYTSSYFKLQHTSLPESYRLTLLIGYLRLVPTCNAK